MKKLILAAALGIAGIANAQLQQGNWFVGSELANMRFTNGFRLSLNPKAAYFVADRWAVGGNVGIDIQKANGEGATQTNWNVGALTRYYFTDAQIESGLNNGTFFAEGTAGVGGVNSGAGNTTNGLQLGIGAGYAYFITRNVSVEGLLKVQGTVGGGNTNSNADVTLGVGFSIYLPSGKAKQVINDQQ